jgi:NTE family protein
VLIEPNHRDPELHLTDAFSYAQRHQMPSSRKISLPTKRALHSISLKHDVWMTPNRSEMNPPHHLLHRNRLRRQLLPLPSLGAFCRR